MLALMSGGGRTLLNLLDAIKAGTLHARIPAAIASRPCAGVERAQARGVPAHVERGVIPADRLEQLMHEHGASWLVLCGYLQRVDIPASLEGRVVNIHPALLPDFGGPGMYGDRVHAAVLQSGKTESGCTVHLCDAEYDNGPIVLQRRCPVLPGDTVDSLAARVFEQECEAYPEALSMLLTAAHTTEGVRP
ncbi:MAG: phosphoribosylglycinamide formyltransferase [Phycisphaerales bacterium]|nr:phosphoribosylglycinamide formyltransferase [Phycisphaerales bacterium]